MRPKVDRRRLALAALGGITGGGAVGLLLGFMVGLSGDIAGAIAGALCVALIQWLYARGQEPNRH